MEKNKRRITHIESGFDDIEDGCRDYVSSIIKDMDSNFKTVQPNKLYRSKKSVVSLTEHVNDEKNTSSASTSKTQGINASRPKKFGIVRKFPLMEKSQKILKHIRHNQRMPKKRAHLASFSNPPVQKKVSRDNFSATNKNSKQTNSKSTKICKKTDKREAIKKSSTSAENHNVYNDENSINENEGDTTDSEYERFVKKNTKHLKKKSSVNKNKANRKSLNKTKSTTVRRCHFSEDDDTASSNSEYKKRKRRKGRDSKKKKQNLLPSESEDDVLNDEIFTRDTSSDSDVAVDIAVTNISLDSNVKSRGNEHTLTPESYSMDVENNMIEQSLYSSCSGDKNVINDTQVSVQHFEKMTPPSDCSSLTSKTANSNVKSRGNEHTLTPESYSIDVENNEIEHSLYSSCSGDKNVINDTQVSMQHFEQIITPPSDCSSLTNKTANNKCDAPKAHDFPVLSLPENCATTNKAQSDEESDIEIVDVVLLSSSKNIVRSKKNAFSPQTLKQQNSKTQLKVEGAKQLTEQRTDTSNGSKTRKNEAVYVTDICREHNEKTDSKISILKQPDCSNSLMVNKNNVTNVSENSVSHNITNLTSPNIKEEDSDDDIVILDCVPNKKCLGVSLNKVKMETPDSVKYSPNEPHIKRESILIDLSSSVNDKNPSNSNVSEIFSRNDNVTLRDLKLYEVAQSNLAHTKNNLPGEMLQKFMPSVHLQDSEKESIDVKHLLDLFKKEFQIYQEIIQTEANVEKSLKTLESYQADKLKNIRTLIQKVVENKTCLGEEKGSKTNELLKLPRKMQNVNKLEPSEKLKTSGAPPKAGVSSQSNLLCADVERDVKPDLSLLRNISESVLVQHSAVRPKTEQELPNASAIRLLGEKCNVCGKEAVAACQRCAKVFFCSNECGKKYWMDGHENECGK